MLKLRGTKFHDVVMPLLEKFCHMSNRIQWHQVVDYWVFLLLLLIAPVAVFAKKGLLILMCLLVLASFRQLTISSVWRHAPELVWGVIALCICSVYGVLGRADQDFINMLRHLLLIPLGLFWIGGLICQNEDALRRNATALVIMVAVMGAFYFIEILSYAFITRQLSSSDFTLEIKMFEKVAGGLPVLTCLFWLIFARLISWSKSIGFCSLIMVTLIVSNLPMAAATLSLLTGGLIFAIAYWARRTVLFLMLVSFLGYSIMAPVLSRHVLTIENVRSLGLVLPAGWEHRIGIWSYVSHKIEIGHPFGMGFDMSRKIGQLNDVIVEIVDQNGAHPPALPLHPHNAVLQVWLELGLLGVASLILVFFGVWRRLWRMKSSRNCNAAAIATLASALVPFLVSFGVWQSWWLATIILIGGAAVILISARSKAVYSPIT